MKSILKKCSLLSLFAAAACALLLVGCAGGNGNQGETEYADDAFIASLAKGYEARDTLIEQSAKEKGSVEYYEKLVDAELNQVEQYQTAQFQDSKLQETAIAYINALKDQRVAAGLYSTDNDQYKKDWQLVPILPFIRQWRKHLVIIPKHTLIY